MVSLSFYGIGYSLLNFRNFECKIYYVLLLIRLNDRLLILS